MSKRDYIAVAAAFKNAKTETNDDRVLRELADTLCGAFWRDNHRFDRSRFLDACGLGD